jgi:hypothetical protein
MLKEVDCYEVFRALNPFLVNLNSKIRTEFCLIGPCAGKILILFINCPLKEYGLESFGISYLLALGSFCHGLRIQTVFRYHYENNKFH